MIEDPLLSELRGAGAVERRGEFELHERKAREKLQQFQLPDPHEYVLQFVETAVLLGASWIDIYVDADEFEMHFDGHSMRRAELESVYSAAFRRRDDDRARAMRHMAFGLIAAAEVQPREIVVASAADEAVLRVDREGDTQVEDGAAPESGTTRIYLRETFRVEHVTEFFHKIGGDLVEERIIRERCRFSPVPIELNGEQVSRGLTLADSTLGAIQIETGEDRISVGLASEPEGEVGESDRRVVPGTATVIQNGVVVDTHRFDSKFGPIVPVAVVESDRLSKNLSQSAFVRDEAWRKLTEGVLERAVWTAASRFVDSSGESMVETRHEWLFDLALSVYEKIGEGALPDDAPIVDALEKLPVWPAVSVPQGVPTVTRGHRTGELVFVPMAALRGESGEPILWTREVRGELLGVEYERPVLRASVPYDRPSSRHQGGSETPDWLRTPEGDVTEELRQIATRRKNRATWKEREPFSIPGEKMFPHRVRDSAGDYTCTVCMKPVHLGGYTRVVCVKGGRKLVSYMVDVALPATEIVIAGDLAVTEEFDDVRCDDAYVDAVFRVVVMLAGLLERCVAESEMTAEEASSGWLFDHVESVTQPEFFANLLRTFRLDLANPLSRFEAWYADRSQTPVEEEIWWFGRRKDGEWRFGGFESLPVGKSLDDGATVSLGMAADLARREGVVRFVGLDKTGDQPNVSKYVRRAREKTESVSSPSEAKLQRSVTLHHRAGWDREVLALTERQREFLDVVLSAPLRDVEDELRREAARRAFDHRAPSPEPIEGKIAAQRSLSEERWEGEIVLKAPTYGDWLRDSRYLNTSEMAGRIEIVIAYDGKLLARRSIEVPLGEFEARVDSTQWSVDANWSDVEEDALYATCVSKLEVAAGEMFVNWFEGRVANAGTPLGETTMSLFALRAVRNERLYRKLWEIPSFHLAGGESTSYLKLRSRLQSCSSLGYVVGERQPLQSNELEPGTPIVRVEDIDGVGWLLGRLFPSVETVDVTDSPDREKRQTPRQRFLKKRRYDQVLGRGGPLPLGSPLHTLAFESGSISGTIGIYPSTHRPAGNLEYVLLHEARILHRETLDVACGRMGAVCYGDDIVPAPDYAGLKRGLPTVHGVLQSAAQDLLKSFCGSLAGAKRTEKRNHRDELVRRLAAHTVALRSRIRVSARGSGELDYHDRRLEPLVKAECFFTAHDGPMNAIELYAAIEERGHRLAIVGDVEVSSNQSPALVNDAYAMSDSELRLMLRHIFPQVELVSGGRRDETEPADGGGARETPPLRESEPQTARKRTDANNAEVAELLAGEIRESLSKIGSVGHALAEQLPLDDVKIVDQPGTEIVVNSETIIVPMSHPAIRFALRDASDPEGISPVEWAYVTSSLYTAISHEFGETTEVEDFAFHAGLVQKMSRKL